MTERRRLPNKRASQNFSLDCADLQYRSSGKAISSLTSAATKAFVCTFSTRANSAWRA
jgi:hypothetical protein